jgi:kynurenine formamidase
MRARARVNEWIWAAGNPRRTRNDQARQTHMSRLIRIDLSPTDYIHVPQAPRIERSPIYSRGPGNEWQMWGVYGVNASGDRVGISNHTWSHLDAPFHLLPDGAGFDRLDPRRYLALRTRVVDLAQTAAERRETIEGVDYHSRIDVGDLPPDLDGFDAVFFATGFSALYGRRYPMREGADAHYPNVTADAARCLAGLGTLKVAAIDGPSFDKPDTHAIAHRILLGRQPEPVLLLETLTIERLRRHYGATLPREVLLTVEPLRALGSVRQDGALSSVYAWAPRPGDDAFFNEFADALCSATLEA